MKAKCIIPCLLLVACATVSQAQQGTFSLRYSVGFPTGQLSDYISDPSFRGFGIAYQYLTPSNIAFGLDAGVNTFYQRKGYDTYTEGTASVSGTQYHYSNNFPVMASVGYYLFPEQSLRPFVKLGVRGVYTNRTIAIGSSYEIETDAWQCSLRSEQSIR